MAHSSHLAPTTRLFFPALVSDKGRRLFPQSHKTRDILFLCNQGIRPNRVTSTLVPGSIGENPKWRAWSDRNVAVEPKQAIMGKTVHALFCSQSAPTESSQGRRTIECSNSTRRPARWADISLQLRQLSGSPTIHKDEAGPTKSVTPHLLI